MKLAMYSKDGGVPKAGHVEGGDTRSLGGPSTLECNEHERNTDWRHRDEVKMEGLGCLVNPVRADGGCDS